MKVQVNRKHFIEVENIQKLELRDGKVFVFQKTGYPKILKARVGLNNFLLRLVNVGTPAKQIKEFKNIK